MFWCTSICKSIDAASAAFSEKRLAISIDSDNAKLLQKANLRKLLADASTGCPDEFPPNASSFGMEALGVRLPRKTP